MNRLSLNPRIADAWIHKAIVLLIFGRITEAVEIAKKVTRNEPQKVMAWYTLGFGLSALHEHEKALDAFNQVILLDPFSTEAYYKKGCELLFFNKREEAIAAWKEAIRIDPDYYQV